MRLRHGHVFSLAMFVSFAITYPRVASAVIIWRTQHADGCRVTSFTDPTAAAQVQWLGYRGAGQVTNAGPLDVFLDCPVVNDSYLDVSGTNGTVFTGISGWANGASDSIVVKTCRTFYSASGTGGTCGAESTVQGPAVVHITPDMAGWTGGSSSDAYYLAVGLRGTNNGSQSTIWNYGTSRVP